MRSSIGVAFQAGKAALDALEADHDYLTAGGVFPEHLIKNFIANKRKECMQMAAIPHPAEFEKYFNEKLSIILKVRAMENFCAVILESENIKK